ncbi:MAG: cytoplasmic protein [Deltaproteobacteria bacterium]|jgi:hypothetical protein|nr:cytoplasmic protein [Deltaproteobacteria bacterium]
MVEDPKKDVDFRIDRSNLYREESFTDLKVGAIRCLTPVKADGSEDKTRKKLFVGSTNVMTPQGPIPIQGMIQAKELQQAIKKFPETMETAMDRLIEEAQKYQEKQQAEDSQIQKPDSRIIIPGR